MEVFGLVTSAWGNEHFINIVVQYYIAEQIGERVEEFGLWPGNTCHHSREVRRDFHQYKINVHTWHLQKLKIWTFAWFERQNQWWTWYTYFWCVKKVCIVENLFVQVDYHVDRCMNNVDQSSIWSSNTIYPFNCSAAICSYVCLVHMNLNLNGCMYNLTQVLILWHSVELHD